MSRCFPYTGVVVKKGRTPGETPTEPIKLQKERLRNHDTEKRNHNKRKKQSEETSHKCVDIFHGRSIRFVTESSRTRKCSSGDLSDGKKERDCLMRISKLKEDSSESVISEEHGQPISPTSICSLSIASKSDNSKAASQSLVERRGSIIKIRFPSRKQLVPESFLAELPAVVVPSTVPDSRTSEGHCEVSSTSGRSSLEPVAGASHSKGLLLKPKMQFESLLEQWVPPPLNFEGNSSDDLDWIFCSKQSDEKCSKRLRSLDEGLLLLPYNSCSDFSWPRAVYLPEAEIYALPYLNLL